MARSIRVYTVLYFDISNDNLIARLGLKTEVKTLKPVKNLQRNFIFKLTLNAYKLIELNEIATDFIVLYPNI